MDTQSCVAIASPIVEVRYRMTQGNFSLTMSVRVLNSSQAWIQALAYGTPS